jgi:anti-sigma B factor antagonist
MSLTLNTTCPDKATPVIAAEGDIDLFTCEGLRAELQQAQALGHRRIVLDLSGVHFLDSAGLAVFISVHRRLQDEGGAFLLVGPQGQPRRALEITRLITIMHLRDSVEEALGHGWD